MVSQVAVCGRRRRFAAGVALGAEAYGLSGRPGALVGTGGEIPVVRGAAEIDLEGGDAAGPWASVLTSCQCGTAGSGA